MLGAFQWGGGEDTTPPPHRGGPATPSPRRPMSPAHMTLGTATGGSGNAMMMMGARAGNVAEGRGGQRGTTIYGAAPASPSDLRSGCINFLPAGGTSGLDKPEGSSGRRGSAGKCLALAGGGVSRSLGDGASPAEEAAGGGDGGGRFAVDKPPSAGGGVRAGSRGATSPGIFGGEGEGGGGRGGRDSPSPRLSRRRQSNTGQLRELVEAWPEEVAAASPAGERRGGGSCGSDGSDGSDNGSDNGSGELGSSGAARCGSSSSGELGSMGLRRSGLGLR